MAHDSLDKDKYTRTLMNEAYRWIEQATREAGRAVESVANNSFVRTVGGAVGLSRLLDAIDKVDVEQVVTSVRKLQLLYPDEKPAQIAERIVAEKALYAGGIGLASSVVPGFLAGLLAIDLAANLVLQAQLVYEIAYAYGLNLQNAERKGEVVLIFGLAFGGNRVLRLGLGPLMAVPVVGPVLGAGTNAATLYSLGYAACRFYEARIVDSAPMTASVA